MYVCVYIYIHGMYALFSYIYISYICIYIYRATHTQVPPKKMRVTGLDAPGITAVGSPAVVYRIQEDRVPEILEWCRSWCFSIVDIFFLAEHFGTKNLGYPKIGHQCHLQKKCHQLDTMPGSSFPNTDWSKATSSAQRLGRPSSNPSPSILPCSRTDDFGGIFLLSCVNLCICWTLEVASGNLT